MFGVRLVRFQGVDEASQVRSRNVGRGVNLPGTKARETSNGQRLLGFL